MRSTSLEKLPRYLLDLTTAAQNGQVRLVETKGLQDLFHMRTSSFSRDQGFTGLIPYAAISYCWGYSMDNTYPQKTLKENLQARLNGFPLEHLPRTLRDAVRVCQALGLMYLWIDAVCIIQDGDDLEPQVRDMAKVYEAAHVVISAASASDANEGFLGPRRQNYEQYELPITFHFPDTDQTETGRVRIVPCIPDDNSEPIDARGWTWQEHRAALRLIRFESGGIKWSCKMKNEHESGLKFKSDRLLSGYGREGAFKKYLEEVEIYSFRETGRADDKLAAFEISAIRISEHLGLGADDYRAGLLKPDLRRQLLWSCDLNHPQKPPASLPSWSWANSRFPVSWDAEDMQYLDWVDFSCVIEDCTTELSEPGRPFGSVKSGQLVVRGYAPEAFWTGSILIEGPWLRRHSPRLEERERANRKKTTKSPDGGVPPRRRTVPPKGWIVHRPLPFYPTWDTPEPPPPQVVKCLEIRSGIGCALCNAYGIVLAPAGEGLFKRIGYFRFEHPRKRYPSIPPPSRRISFNWIHKSKRETVCII